MKMARFGMAVAAAVTLAWSDDLPANVAGVKVYWGRDAGIYSEHRTFTDVAAKQVALDLPEGRWFIVATVVDTSGRESDFSNVVTHDDGLSPASPRNLRVNL